MSGGEGAAAPGGVKVKADTVKLPSRGAAPAAGAVAGALGGSFPRKERTRSVIRQYLEELGLQDTMLRAPVAMQPAAAAAKTAGAGLPQQENVVAAAPAKPSVPVAPVAVPAAAAPAGEPALAGKSAAATSAGATAATVAATAAAIISTNTIAAAAGVTADASSSPAKASADLGDLATMTMRADEPAARTWKPKHSLRSHLDAVRVVAFHAKEQLLFSASEDCTLKCWSLSALGAAPVAKKSAALPDVEPIHTFRGHRGPVYALAMAPDGESFFSAGSDGCVRAWSVPPASASVYDPHSSASAFSLAVARGHSDAVWQLRMHELAPLLASGSADRTVRLWSTDARLACRATIQLPDTPTALDFVPTNPNRIVIALRDSSFNVYDVNTLQCVSSFRATDGAASETGVHAQPNSVVCHPTLSLLFSAHENKYLRMFDINTGETVHALTAHRSAVSSLALDPSGLTLASSGHDASLRFWDIASRRCSQEITVHRMKHEEAIHDVCYHPTLPYLASAGADANIKVYA